MAQSLSCFDFEALPADVQQRVAQLVRADDAPPHHNHAAGGGSLRALALAARGTREMVAAMTPPPDERPLAPQLTDAAGALADLLVEAVRDAQAAAAPPLRLRYLLIELVPYVPPPHRKHRPGIRRAFPGWLRVGIQIDDDSAVEKISVDSRLKVPYNCSAADWTALVVAAAAAAEGGAARAVLAAQLMRWHPTNGRVSVVHVDARNSSRDAIEYRHSAQFTRARAVLSACLARAAAAAAMRSLGKQPTVGAMTANSVAADAELQWRSYAADLASAALAKAFAAAAAAAANNSYYYLDVECDEGVECWEVCFAFGDWQHNVRVGHVGLHVDGSALSSPLFTRMSPAGDLVREEGAQPSAHEEDSGLRALLERVREPAVACIRAMARVVEVTAARRALEAHRRVDELDGLV